MLNYCGSILLQLASNSKDFIEGCRDNTANNPKIDKLVSL